MPAMEDPRVFFAAERTLLAWVRSGLTVMALGFVVARFSLLLSLVAASQPPPAGGQRPHWSSALGIALVVLGAGSILGALQNHRSYVRSLPPENLPELAIPWLTAFLALVLALIGFLLAIYLAVT
jgi:putative membrane protein